MLELDSHATGPPLVIMRLSGPTTDADVIVALSHLASILDGDEPVVVIVDVIRAGRPSVAALRAVAGWFEERHAAVRRQLIGVAIAYRAPTTPTFVRGVVRRHRVLVPCVLQRSVRSAVRWARVQLAQRGLQVPAAP